MLTDLSHGVQYSQWWGAWEAQLSAILGISHSYTIGHKPRHYNTIMKSDRQSAPFPGGGGGGALGLVCVLGMCHPQGCVFHSYRLGRVLFSNQQSGKGCVLIPVFDTMLSFCKGVWPDMSILFHWSHHNLLQYRPLPYLARPRNPGKGCNFTNFFLGRVGKFGLGRVQVCHPVLCTLSITGL